MRINNLLQNFSAGFQEIDHYNNLVGNFKKKTTGKKLVFGGMKKKVLKKTSGIKKAPVFIFKFIKN